MSRFGYGPRQKEEDKRANKPLFWWEAKARDGDRLGMEGSWGFPGSKMLEVDAGDDRKSGLVVEAVDTILATGLCHLGGLPLPLPLPPSCSFKYSGGLGVMSHVWCPSLARVGFLY